MSQDKQIEVPENTAVRTALWRSLHIDLVAEQAARGVGQYVILGVGLDTFAQRRPEHASRLLVFEIDQPGPRDYE